MLPQWVYGLSYASVKYVLQLMIQFTQDLQHANMYHPNCWTCGIYIQPVDADLGQMVKDKVWASPSLWVPCFYWPISHSSLHVQHKPQEITGFRGRRHRCHILSESPLRDHLDTEQAWTLKAQPSPSLLILINFSRLQEKLPPSTQPCTPSRTTTLWVERLKKVGFKISSRSGEIIIFISQSSSVSKPGRYITPTAARPPGLCVTQAGDNLFSICFE